jgi:hypothetical protein
MLVGPIRKAPATDLRKYELMSAGAIIYWPKFDDGLDLDEIAEDILGLRLASSAARKAGSVRSESKAASSRANGAKGGRPRKQAV